MKTNKRWILPAIAFLGLLLAISEVYMSHRARPEAPIPFRPPTSPYENFVAGVGLVEPNTRKIEIGSPFQEIVDCIFITEGDEVEEGDPLFKLNTETFEKQLAKARKTFDVVWARYEMQKHRPRPEEVPPEAAKVEAAEANYLDYTTRYGIVDSIEDPKAISLDEVNQRKYAMWKAKYQLEEEIKNYELLLAGTWFYDLEITSAQLKEADAEIEKIQNQIDRSTIRAPCHGTVLDVNTNVGELSTDVTEGPLIVFGNICPLNLRVEIDEEDVWRVFKEAKGTAFIRGNSSISTPLTFRYLTPFLKPKRQLTGDNTERIDTRVLEIHYSIDREDIPIYAGELMDVFLEAKPQ